MTMKPTGPSRAGGRNLVQTPTLVVVLVVFGREETVYENRWRPWNFWKVF